MPIVAIHTDPKHSRASAIRTYTRATWLVTGILCAFLLLFAALLLAVRYESSWIAIICALLACSLLVCTTLLCYLHEIFDVFAPASPDDSNYPEPERSGTESFGHVRIPVRKLPQRLLQMNTRRCSARLLDRNLFEVECFSINCNDRSTACMKRTQDAVIR